MLKLLSTCLAIILAQSTSGQIRVDDVRFKACTDENCSDVTRWRTDRNHKTLRVVCNIKNVAADQDEYFVLVSTEYIVAPTTVYSVKDFDRLRNEVSWGRVATQDDDMNSVVVRALRPGMSQELAIETFDPDSLIQKFPRNSDNLWPWLARVNIFVMDQRGRLVVSANAILEIEPTSDEVRADPRDVSRGR